MRYAAQRKSRMLAMTPEERRKFLDHKNQTRKPQTPEQKELSRIKRLAFWNGLSDAERRKRIAKMKTYDSQHGEMRAKRTRASIKKRISLGKCAASDICNDPLAGNSKFCLKHWLVTIAAANNRTEKCSWRLLLKIWNKQSGLCPITGAQLVPAGNTNLDHIIPVSDGGGNNESNLRFVHQVFNDMKDDLSDEKLKSFIRSFGIKLIQWAEK